MNCTTIQQKISEHLDNKTAFSAEIQDHISKCDSCRKFVEASAVLESVFTEKKQQPVSISDSLHTRIMDAVRDVDTKQKKQIIPFRLFRIAAAASLVAGISLAVFFSMKTSPVQPDPIHHTDQLTDTRPTTTKFPRLPKTNSKEIESAIKSPFDKEKELIKKDLTATRDFMLAVMGN